MSVDLGLLILRLVVGLLVAGHGAQKLFGWFGGSGLKGTDMWLASLGLQSSNVWAVLAGLCEFGGGLLMAVGLLNPLGPLGIIASMVTAIVFVHWKNGLWIAKNGLEFTLTNITVALAVAVSGAGAYSLDALLGIALPAPYTLIIGLLLIGIGVAATRLRIQQLERA